MNHVTHPSRRNVVLAALLILVIGTGLRLVSFAWNTRLKGDVALLALTAREFAQHGRLDYPMAYGPAAYISAQTLTAPATQHPPLFPFLGGLLAIAAGTDDTFLTLKIIDLVGGLLLLAALLAAGLRGGWPFEALVAGLGIAVAPMLVDYSANGSPYILSALAILLATLLMRSFAEDRLRDYALAGMLCGLSLGIHSILIGLPVGFISFWLVQRKQPNFNGIGLFIGALLITVSPWIIWNMVNVGTPMYSSSTQYVLERLQIANFHELLTAHKMALYARLTAAASLLFVSQYIQEVGPFAVLLAAAGLCFLIRRQRRFALAVLIPGVLYTLMVVIWPVFKYRFLVPLLAPAYLLAGIGFTRLPEIIPWKPPVWRGARWLLLVGMLAWCVPAYFTHPPTHYYSAPSEASLAPLYDEMRGLADQMRALPPGGVMGYSKSLDGGLETVYWTRLPYVHVPDGQSAEQLAERARQYPVRYVWGDQKTAETITTTFPAAKVVLSSGPFSVYDLQAK
jgi:hypothetical protein